MRRRLWENAATMEWLNTRVDELESGQVTPYMVADELLSSFGDLVKGDMK